MTSPANDTSELTAYAMGELQPHQAHEIHQLLATCPAATSELEQIEAVTDALRHHAPIPQDRLYPDQRHAVLYPKNLPRRMTPMAPRQPKKRPQSVFWPILAGVAKAAAVLALAGLAFLWGKHTSSGPALSRSPAPEASKEPKLANAPSPMPERKFLEKNTASAVAPASANAVKPALVALPKAPTPSPTPVAEKPKALAESKIPEKVIITAAPAPKTATKTSATKPEALAVLTHLNPQLGFVSTQRTDVDRFAVKPADIRPRGSASSSETLFASPQKNPPKPRTQPEDLYIHSWRAEVTSCPWNTATRLLRVSIQLPPNQPSAASATAFPLEVSFDRRFVREYRRLGERFTFAKDLTTSGLTTFWYEFQPVGDEAVRSGKAVATLTLDRARFTMPSVGPFDESKLSVLDRGQNWAQAREDYLFEASVISFGMLLKGDHRSPALTHELVAELATKGRGQDASGERARFLESVRSAQKAAGLQ